MKNLLSPSWRTSAAGVLGFLDLLVGQMANLVDDKPETSFDFNLIIGAAIIMWGLLNARDNKVSTEQARDVR